MSDRVIAVFSGGGAKGAAHVGAVRAMEEFDLRPAHYVATSIGAVMAACFASGLAYEDVLQRLTALTRRDVAALSARLVLGILARSLLRPEPFKETIRALVPARRFSELTTPLTVTAVDARTGELVLFGEGGRFNVPLCDALYASCALPMYYPPALIGDREYIDGGLRSVLPIEVASQFDPTMVVAVSVGPTLHADEIPSGPVAGGLVGAHRRSLRIMMAAQTEASLHRWRLEEPAPLVLVRPRVDGNATFRVDRIVDFVGEGYRATYRELSSFSAGTT